MSICSLCQAQHSIRISAELNDDKHRLSVNQEVVFRNQTGDTLSSVVFNNWAESYSGKDTPLAKRFSDEFVRSFHLSQKEERGFLSPLIIEEEKGHFNEFSCDSDQPDVLEVQLSHKLAPGQTATLHLMYTVKLPSDSFTHFGYGIGSYYLRDFFLTPARYEHHSFVRYSNKNTDDCTNAAADYELTFRVPSYLTLYSDLDQQSLPDQDKTKVYQLEGKNRVAFALHLTNQKNFEQYRNSTGEVTTDLRDLNLSSVEKAILIDKITRFVQENVGKYPFSNLIVSEADYQRNPFYGLNQLPSFLSPFSNDYLYEIKFLKTYLSAYLRNSLKLDPRKDHWIYDGIQIYTMMKYIDEFYPDAKMTGNLSKLKLFKSYNLTQLPFNEQYSYFYMLMARKNLDQPLGEQKDALIRFNEQIAVKYRAGLSLRYLEAYAGQQTVGGGIQDFFRQSTSENISYRSSFENILKQKAGKRIDWFFNTIVDSREIVDYKFTDARKEGDSIRVSIRNKTGTNVPIPIYGVKGREIRFKQWLENMDKDTTFTLPANGAEKVVLNYNNEVPEYNLRNNWRSFGKLRIGNRPIKFVFFKDLEDSYYNQILFLPTFSFNVYDGVAPGIRFHNRTILDKPFMFDITPMYSTKQQTLIGSFNFTVNQNNRHSRLYNIRYQFGGSYYHYAPDAAYLKLNPAVWFRIRDRDMRSNHQQMVLLRNVLVDRQTSLVVPPDDETVNYNVFNARYVNSKTEVRNHLSFVSDLQFSKDFGKAYAEFGYRKLFNDNRQINLRLFAGSFLYRNTDSDYFSFGLDRPTDYLFDYEYYGRSETSGLFSQQLIVAEGGFKSQLEVPFANKWMTTANMSFNIWNWIETYGDVGLVANENLNTFFAYDSGIRLNLVTDYFELYFPVYSNNGWEIGRQGYEGHIRFIVTLSPKMLATLFTRKWL